MTVLLGCELPSWALSQAARGRCVMCVTFATILAAARHCEEARPTKQSSHFNKLDCFAEPDIGPRASAHPLACNEGCLPRRHRLALDLNLEVRPGEASNHQIGRGRIGIPELARPHLAGQR